MNGDSARPTVVSVRLSESEQTSLRQLAQEQGKSVSDVVRNLVASRLGPELPQGSTHSAVENNAIQIEHGSFHGMFWSGGDGAVVSGATMTISASDDD